MSIKFNKPYLVNNQPRVMRRQTRAPTALAEATMSTWVLGRSAGSLTGSASGSTSTHSRPTAIPLFFKPVMYRGGKPKGNVDAELVLQAVLLKRAARERVDFLEDARRKLEYKSEGAPPQDGT